MQLAQVVGHTTATVKHPSLNGWKLLVVQPLDAKQKADGNPLIAIDQLGCGLHSTVMITSDGASVREMVGTNQTPIRWAVLGLVDN